MQRQLVRILLFQVDLVIKIIAINQISISKSDFNVEAMDSAFECNSNMRSIYNHYILQELEQKTK